MVDRPRHGLGGGRATSQGRRDGDVSLVRAPAPLAVASPRIDENCVALHIDTSILGALDKWEVGRPSVTSQMVEVIIYSVEDIVNDMCWTSKLNRAVEIHTLGGLSAIVAGL